MAKSLTAVGVIMVVVGVLWIFQGLGYVGGSFMTGQQQWTWIGAVTTVIGGLVLLLAYRRKA